MQLLFLVLLFTSTTSLLTTRKMHMEIYHNSYYQLGYYNNFIRNVTARSLMRCALACQNNDQCRLANYFAQLSICSLYDESSFVGQMITTSMKSSVIVLQLCEDPAKQEPEYVCFGSVRPAVTVQSAINNSQSVKNISLTTYHIQFSSTGLFYVVQHQSDTVNVYELKRYTESERLIIFPGQMQRSFEADFGQNYFVLVHSMQDTSKGISINSRNVNKTISPTTQYYETCLSERYFIGTHETKNNTIGVYERSTGQLAFEINGTDSPLGCKVIRDQLYFLTSSSGMMSTNIVNRTGAVLKNWPFSATCRPGGRDITVDSSGRTYMPCLNSGGGSTCMNSALCSIVSNGLTNAPLATMKNFWYTSGRADKYKYRFAGADNPSGLVNIFEY